eukprot:2876884-Amphidinium_carterae.1
MADSEYRGNGRHGSAWDRGSCASWRLLELAMGRRLAQGKSVDNHNAVRSSCVRVLVLSRVCGL